LYNAIGYTLTKTNGRGRAGIQNVTTTINVGGKRIKVKGIVTAGKGGSASTASGARVDRPSRRAHFVEFGTRRMPAEPFMIPAAESQVQPYLARCMAAGKQAEQDLSVGRFT
jgi:HK97 gp10 family phage protein